MAEILIVANHPDGPATHGKIVSVNEDGFEWGKLEALPPAMGGVFIIIKAPGPAKQYKPFLQKLLDSDPSKNKEAIELAERKYKFNLSLLDQTKISDAFLVAETTMDQTEMDPGFFEVKPDTSIAKADLASVVDKTAQAGDAKLGG